MDFGVVSLKQTSPNAGACLASSDGSVNLNHQRSDHCWRSHKMLKPSQVDFSSSDAFAAFGRSNLWPPPPPPDDGQKMLSFSSSAPHCGGATADAGRSITFSICHDESNTRTGGSSLRGSFSRLKGPFTPSQWMELEHQALIYKHIVANVPVPSNLLVPLKRSLYSYGSPAVYASNFLGWGPFHLGFSGSNDPEPGRCRRTDGKKWRCSRDAVPEQKYCERHINRGRHRSRKPVEGQTGHASKLSSNASSSLPSPAQLKPSNPNTSTTDRSQDFRGLSLIPPTVNLKPKEVPFSIQKQYEESSNSDFGIVSSDCLLNPSEKISYMNNGGSSDSLMRLGTKEASSQHPVHHFIDDWPKDESDRGSGSWPDELKSDWTQLSMSIPIAPDFSSSSTSPAQEKSTLPSLRLSHEVDPIPMSLGMSRDLVQSVEKQSSWSPIIWGNTMGGPLGEVLTITNTGADVGPDFSSTKAFIDREMGSSPTGVLQKSTFVSLSNSSSGGSPTNAENSKALCNNLLGSAVITSTTIPSLFGGGEERGASNENENVNGRGGLRFVVH